MPPTTEDIIALVETVRVKKRVYRDASRHSADLSEAHREAIREEARALAELQDASLRLRLAAEDIGDE